MANTDIIKGSSFLFQGSVKGLGNSQLKDSDIEATAEFYIQNTYSKEGAKKVSVGKSAMSVEGNTFSCYVDTTELSTGNLACVLMVSYPNPFGGTKLKEIIPVKMDVPCKIITLA